MLKETLIRAALIVVGIAVALLAFEFGMRLLPRSMFPAAARHLIELVESNAPARRVYSIDPKLGWVYKPGLDTIVEQPDFSFRVKPNLNTPQAGFRGATRAGPVWGLALGDSFTFGYGVNHEKTWEALLAEKSERNIVNLGVPGWAPLQYTLSLEKFGIPLNPKVIFYGLYANDLAESVRFKKRNGRFDRFSTRVFLNNHSIIFNLVKKLTHTGRVDAPADIQLSEVGLRFSVEHVTQSFLKQARYSNRGWELIVPEITKADEASRRIDAKFVLLYFPSKEEAYWELLKEKASFPTSVEQRVGAISRKFEEVCQSRQLLCLDLTPALKRHAAQGEKLYFTFDTHWTERGNEVVANELYSFLNRNKLL